MRLPPSKPANGLLLSSILFPALIAAVGNLDCSKIVIEKKVFDLSPLGGPHSVTDSQLSEPTLKNWTYTLDICTNLKRSPDIDKKYQCAEGTRVCAIEHTISDDSDNITEVIPIAGDLRGSITDGGDLDARVIRLKTEDSNWGSEKEGLRIVLNGGVYGKPKRRQRAIIEFLCPMGDAESGKDLDPEGTLKYKGYDRMLPDAVVDTLRLEWTTKHACEKDTPTGGHWGFFTWFLIIAFLVTAAYLIFGSWLNYNRYGARGWDLLPHGDTIRDVPYLLKDWTRKVVNTVQGSGSRGGYSAV